MKRILIITAFAASVLCLSITVFVYFQHGGKRTSAQSKTDENVNCRVEKPTPANEKCDFSDYKTLRVKSLKIESLPQPEYPPEAKDRNLRGCVPVKILVDKEGEVSQACVPNKDEKLKDCQEPLNEEAFSTRAREAALKAKFDVRRVSLHEKDFFEMTIIYNFNSSAK